MTSSKLPRQRIETPVPYGVEVLCRVTGAVLRMADDDETLYFREHSDLGRNVRCGDVILQAAGRPGGMSAAEIEAMYRWD